MADEPLTNREILGKFEDVRRDQSAIDTRVNTLAQSTVSVDSWTRENSHLAKDIAEVDAHCEERHQIVMAALADVKKSVSQRSEITWQRVLGIASILAVLAAAWYTAVHQGGH